MNPCTLNSTEKTALYKVSQAMTICWWIYCSIPSHFIHRQWTIVPLGQTSNQNNFHFSDKLMFPFFKELLIKHRYHNFGRRKTTYFCFSIVSISNDLPMLWVAVKSFACYLFNGMYLNIQFLHFITFCRSFVMLLYSR